MPASFPPAMIKELRHLVASAIADAKAYDVPALCRRLNLGDGGEQEAFASKYKYAQKRLVISPPIVCELPWERSFPSPR
jgi:hypothetical protein